MDSLKSLYPEVKDILQNAIPTYWPELGDILSVFFEESIMAAAILPLASCQAVNGDPKDAVPVSAALLAFGASWRILDDLVDQDRSGKLWEVVGTARAWNYASAVHVLAFEILNNIPLELQVFREINQSYLSAFLCIAAGQDRDIIGATKTIDDYWLTIQMKIASASTMACKTGAMVGTADPELIQACGVFGHHLGLAIQILNDMESIWQPHGITDLEQGKITLPLLYGLQVDHPERKELLSIVNAQNIAVNADKIQAILDGIDTKIFLIWAALKEREQALEAIKICPNSSGKAILEAYITGMFGDIDTLI